MSCAILSHMGHRSFNVINAVQLMKIFVFFFADAINPIQSLHLGQY